MKNLGIPVDGDDDTVMTIAKITIKISISL